jgi:hypothetical protein
VRAAGVPRRLSAYLREVATTAREPSLLLWSLYLLLFPVYVFPSGLPQPGDMLIVIFAPVVLMAGRVRAFRAGVPAIRALLCFTAYVVLVNVTWALMRNNFDTSLKFGFLLHPLFYIYNAIVFVLAIILYTRHRARFLWLTLQLVLLSLILVTLISIVRSGGSGRATALFNNPNQLGYYAVLSVSILALGRRWLGLGTVQSAVGFACATYLSLMSSSVAALGSIAVLVVVSTVTNPKLIVLAMAAAAAFLLFDNRVTDALEKTQTRLEHKKKRSGFFEDRGYDRILNNREYWILGAGEGEYGRFKETTLIGGSELHSSAGTLFFCYGAVGMSLFLWFAVRLVKGASIWQSMALVPAAVYGLTHQGLRFTLLWVLFVVFLAVKDFESERREAGRKSAAQRDRKTTAAVRMISLRSPTKLRLRT